jgi:sterol desaturase/sphingolipid hydroxylase (fatty acid hydroxylase superfamily)
MEFEKIHNKGQARLFKNKYLEFFTKTHPLFIWSMYIPIVSFMLWYSNAHFGLKGGKVALIFFTGMLFWTLVEYILHRFIFHFIAESEKGKKITYVMHGNHHEYPRDRKRLFMPALPSLILASIFFSMFYGIGYLMGLQQFTFSFFPGFMIGYLLYGSMHYAIHAWNPPFKWMKPLWRNHHLHHYKQDHRGFGVSSTLWDHVFGTMFDLKNEKEDKAKVQELMFTKKNEKTAEPV